MQVELVYACGNHINLGVAREREVNHRIFAVVGCGLRWNHELLRGSGYHIGNRLSFSSIVEPIVAQGQQNGVAQADNGLVADGNLHLGVGDIAEAVSIAEGEYPVTHTGIGVHRYIHNVGIGDTVGVVASDAITERRCSSEGDMQIFAAVVALADNSSAQCGR